MSQSNIEQAVSEQRLNLERWANGMIEQLHKRFATQNTWPLGYPGPYRLYKVRHKGSSTGEAYRNIWTTVFNGANGDTEKVSFFFREYLYFVDMGVGAGQPLEKVDNAAPARWNRLYKTWQGEGDRQSRPQLTMEIRHQVRRLTTLLATYYNDCIENGLVFSFQEDETQTK